MKGQIFNPGQPQKKESFDHSQDSLEEAIRERGQDLMSPGILRDSQFGVETVPLEIFPDGGLTIRVGTGVALAPHDVDRPEFVDGQDASKTGGERTFIPTADTAALPANIYARSAGGGPGTGTGTGPFKESPNGLGGWTSTPQSTKTRSIPLVNGQLNRVWIAYLGTIDTSVTSLHKVQTSKILYPKGEDGYDIVVNQSGTPPGGDPKYEFLGTVDLTTSPGLVTSGMISHAGRRFAGIRPKRVHVRLEPLSLKPTSISVPSTQTLEDHVNSVGSGVITPSNVHGLTLTDLGVTQDIDLRRHRVQDHTNGLVVTTEGSTTSALYPRTDNSTPTPGDAAMVFLKRLAVTNETILVNGTVYSHNEIDPAVKLLTPVGSAAAGDYYVSFGTSHAAGVYGIVLKEVGTILTLEKRSSPFTLNADTDYLVCTVEWNGTAFINPSPPNVQLDSRVFGTIARRNMQKNSVETLQIADLAVTTPKIGPSAVTTAKIADLNVTTPKLDDNSVTTQKIAGLNVTTPKIDDLAVTAAKLATDSVITAKILDDAVTSQKIDEWDGASLASQPDVGSGIATAHIKDEAITLAKLDAALAASIAGAAPIGSVTAFAGTTVPAGWVECDGSAVSRTVTYNNLFAVISTIWGVGDGSTTFNLPDFRGRFPRGQDGAAGNDPDSASRFALHTGGNTGNAVGSYQDDSLEDHTHLIWGVGAAHGGGNVAIYNGINGALSFASAGTSTTPNNETRPKNAYVKYIIKY